jgi:hypothetical protein
MDCKKPAKHDCGERETLHIFSKISEILITVKENLAPCPEQKVVFRKRCAAASEERRE